ncbi:MAG: hypothetical protein Q7K29_05600 [Thermoleophilia bacterium]|nr:hypothetical protein [Thermoleophilia bacterium]
MDIAESAARGDEVLEMDGLKVFLEKEANKQLNSATIDYSDARGFVIQGQQQGSCNC